MIASEKQAAEATDRCQFLTEALAPRRALSIPGRVIAARGWVP